MRKHARYLCVASVACLMVIVAPDLGFGQDEPCDSAVRPVDGPHGYMSRPEPLRCEGFHKRNISGTPLFLVQLVFAYEPYDLESSEPITLQWQTPYPDDTVRIQALSIPGKLDAAYRMDAAFVEEAELSWPTDFLRVTKIAPEALAVSARTREGGVGQDVHLPLDMYQGVEPGPGELTMGFFTRVALSDVLLVVTRPDNDSTVAEVRPQGAEMFGAMSTVSFSIPDLAPGIYKADFTAMAGRPNSDLMPVSGAFHFYARGAISEPVPSP